jgi:4a-hydroxytetrahydrobiopterin dehydratase
MPNLAEKQCIPCQGGTPPLKGEALSTLLEQLAPGWKIVDEHHLTKELEFANFSDALGFVNRVGELAEEQGHHPDIFLAWGKVRLDLWTHKAGGLTESDFVFAAKADGVVGAGTE